MCILWSDYQNKLTFITTYSYNFFFLAITWLFSDTPFITSRLEDAVFKTQYIKIKCTWNKKMVQISLFSLSLKDYQISPKLLKWEAEGICDFSPSGNKGGSLFVCLLTFKSRSSGVTLPWLSLRPQVRKEKRTTSELLSWEGFNCSFLY